MAKNGSCCELCSAEAKMFCESDQARLCWDCDDKVHAANFLVMKHTRAALCHVCRCATQWKASGPNLGRTVSVCGGCVAGSVRIGGGSEGRGVEEEKVDRRRSVRIAVGEDREHDGEYEDCTNTDEDDDYSDDDEFEDDDENQVVPWASFPPESIASTSYSDVGEEELESTSGFGGSPIFLHSDDELGVGVPSSSSVRVRSRVTWEEDEDILRGQWKQRRVETR